MTTHPRSHSLSQKHPQISFNQTSLSRAAPSPTGTPPQAPFTPPLSRQQRRAPQTERFMSQMTSSQMVQATQTKTKPTPITPSPSASTPLLHRHPLRRLLLPQRRRLLKLKQHQRAQEMFISSSIHPRPCSVQARKIGVTVNHA